MRRIKVYRQITGTLQEWYEVDEITPEIIEAIANEELQSVDSDLMWDTIESDGEYEIFDDMRNLLKSTYE